MEPIGGTAHPLRVAIVGSGPAGFYAAEALLKAEAPCALVDVFDRLPTPYGLVRGGVAPDHQKIKSVIRLYERTAERERFRFFGHVHFGRDLQLKDLLAHYHQVLLCTGADSDNRMGILGEELEGSFPATEFVGWYNGHPDYTHLRFDLSGPRAAVIGNGNVAMDVVRILSKPVAELERTDIADDALAALRTSGIREIYMLGRRGPAQAAFTNPEIRELAALEGVDLVVRPEDLELDAASRAFLEQAREPTQRRNVEILTAQLDKGQGQGQKKIRAWFFTSPVEVLGRQGKVGGLRLEKNRLTADAQGHLRAHGTGETQEIPIQLLFRSIGYRGTALPGIPFAARSGTIPHQAGRVQREGKTLPRVYVAGWIKRGPSGVIGTNKADAMASVKSMWEDLPTLPALSTGTEALFALLRERGCVPVSFADWRRLDAMEIQRGEAQGRPRVKFTRVTDMLAALLNLSGMKG